MFDSCAGTASYDDAVNKLNQVGVRFTDMGRLVFNPTPSGGAGTPNPNFGPIANAGINLNSQVDWLNPNNTTGYILKDNSSDGPSFNYRVLDAFTNIIGYDQLNADQFMALTLLHELSHNFGMTHPASSGEDNLKILWDTCFLGK